MTDVKVDKDWKKEAKAAKEDLTAKAEKKEDPRAYVSCAEVALYLTELSNVLEQFVGGIRSSMDEMMKRAEENDKKEGDKNDGE